MKKYLYFAVFASGMTSLAIEMAASRLLGSVFGTSNLVWASIIGLIMIYLSIGYFWGGRWADRSPYPQTLFKVMAWGAFMTGLVPLIARPLLPFAADAFDNLQLGILFGSFSAVLLLFIIPVTLLGMISPFAIRIAMQQTERAGNVSGQIYAISTLGSFVGTFLPVLVLIPIAGTTNTFLIFSLFLLVVALVGLALAQQRRQVLLYLWMPLLLLVLGYFLSRQPIKTSVGQIYETESAYNYIQVLQIDDYRMLRLNEGQGVHSMWHPTKLDFAGPWEEFLAAPFLNAPDYSPERVQRVAILGLAAGTFARQATAVFGPVPIDGYEIDPAIIAVGRKYFDMNEPNLNPVVQDGRWGLAHSKQRYTLIALDAYQPPYIPWHLTTQEFFQTIHDHLTADGAVAINVGRSPKDRRLLDDLVSTLQTVFPSVYVMDVPDTFNSVLYATVQPTRVENLYRNYIVLSGQKNVHPLLLESIRRFVVNQKPATPGGRIFTDDRAPIELITNQMVLNYVFSNDVETIR
jgi:spermidine synthase